MRHLTAGLARAAIIASAAAIAAPAAAQQQIGQNPMEELFEAFGMGNKEKPEIDYRERPPLVPPTSTAALPPPVAKGAVGRDSGQWPVDPDEERRAARKAEADLPKTETMEYRMQRNPRLMPSELGGKRTAGGGVVDSPGSTSFDNMPTRLSPAQLRAQGTISAAPAAAPAGEPQRRRLTDPPTGYRAPAPGVYAEQAAAAPEGRPWYKKINPFSRDD